jgi:geranylgeranyl diphosphate synthase, type I
MSHNELLDRYDSLIESDLGDLFASYNEAAKRYHPHISQVYEILEEFVLRGGKRLAACSTLDIYKGYQGAIDKKILRVCSGIELYRHAILVHDDIVDREMLRRGGETLHKVLGSIDEQIGLGSAIFAGNILYSMSLHAVLNSGFDAHKTNELAGLLASEYKNVNESQILDLLFEYKEPSVAEWETMASKRAVTLFKAAMLAGAILGSATDEDKANLEKAAIHIGLAFDIQDDIIDTFATRAQYGRDPCGDIAKRKKPLHIAIALTRGTNFASLMQNHKELTSEDIIFVQDLIRNCGALDEAKAISRSHAQEAKQIISETKMSEEDKSFFISLIEYVEESLEWYK